MADESTTVSAPVVADASHAPVVEGTSDLSTSGAEPDMAAIIAEIEAMPEGKVAPEGAAEPVAGELEVEAKADEPPATETEAKADEAANVQAARKMLAAANKAQAKALKAVPEAEAKLFQLFKSDPAAFLAKAGISVQDWLTAVANGEAGTEPKAPTEADRVTALEKAEEARKLAVEAVKVEGIKTQIHDLVKADPTFKRINAKAQHGLVTDVMVDYYNTHGAPLPWQTAAKQVETYLRSLSDEPAPAQIPAPAPKANSTRQASQTLTNTSTRGATTASAELPMDPDARYRAVLAELERGA